MLNKKVHKLLNSQINAEIYSAYLYLDFANIFASKGLKGFAHYYNLQAKEELEHAEKMRDYVLSNGEKVSLEAINKPQVKSEDNLEILKQALEHEEYVSSLINNIYSASLEVKEYKTVEFLNWFVKEQVEEEDNANSLVEEYKLFGSSIEGLYKLNAQLANRK